MKATVNLTEKFKRPLRNPYNYLVFGAKYLVFRAKVLRLGLEEWKSKSNSADSLPVPPPLLRFRVHGALDLGSYLQIGRTCAQDIKDLLSTVGKDLYSFNQILDFGCGSGRVMLFFNDRPDSCHLHGTDIDKQAIYWAKKHLRFASWSTNNPLPPTAYADHTFDFIYAISVFTHINEKMQFAWLNELKRISKPDGTLILTVHGENTYAKSKEKKAIISEKGFLYTVGQTGMFKLDGLPDFYQTTFHSRAYIEDRWSKLFKIIGYVERGLAAYQDAVILLNR